MLQLQLSKGIPIVSLIHNVIIEGLKVDKNEAIEGLLLVQIWEGQLADLADLSEKKVEMQVFLSWSTLKEDDIILLLFTGVLYYLQVDEQAMVVLDLE